MRQYNTDFRSNYLQGNSAKKHQGQQSLALCQDVLRILFSSYRGPVALQLWDGLPVIGSRHASCTLIFKKQYPLRILVLNKDLSRLVVAYLQGDVEVEGDFEDLFSLVDYLRDCSIPLLDQFRLILALARLSGPARISDANELKSDKRYNSRETISHHYDVGNDFYRLFLDKQMVYSCAYFRDAKQTLDEAQGDKLEHICRKLRLQPGMHVLDIGCGWGGLAIHAAQRYGVSVHGITLSEQQYDLAQQRITKLGLQDDIRIELRDYRELEQAASYDRIVSVGMFEHIGTRNFELYFGLINRLLKDNGLFLNHGITNDTGWDDSPERRFINEYIFPDGELARISTVLKVMENCGFEIADVESLRPHYVMTLRRWLQALNNNKDQAEHLAGEATYRLWLLYMSGSAYYFNKGEINIYQVLACKAKQPWPLPLRRDDLYSNS